MERLLANRLLHEIFMLGKPSRLIDLKHIYALNGAMLLFGMGLAAGVSHAHAATPPTRETTVTSHHIPHRVAQYHHSVSTHRISHPTTADARKHSSAYDLSLSHQLSVWGGAALGSPISFSLAETVGIL